jgi:hypothetical protein
MILEISPAVLENGQVLKGIHQNSRELPKKINLNYGIKKILIGGGFRLN